MKVHKRERSGIVVLTLRGEFDSFVTAAFMHEVDAIHRSGVHLVVLNLRFVKFISSTALGAMLKLRKQCLAAEGNLVLSHPSSTVREALESLHLEHLFVIVDNDDEAITSLGGESEPGDDSDHDDDDRNPGRPGASGAR